MKRLYKRKLLFEENYMKMKTIPDRLRKTTRDNPLPLNESKNSSRRIPWAWSQRVSLLGHAVLSVRFYLLNKG